MTREEFQKRFSYDPDTDRLGEGGFGEVFKAYDTVRDRYVAIKVSKVKPEFENLRLRKEVETVNRLPEHPNIAFYEACYTFREMSGEYDFGILQYYEEGNLMQWMRGDAAHGRGVARNAPTRNAPAEQKTAILSQILEGIDFLHQNGIVHRDLKPPNILIVRRQNGQYIPKITDFGISKQLDVNNSSVVSNSLAGAGTLAYSSPEQLTGNRIIRKNTDLWSFGVIAFQTFTGQLPFTTGTHASTSEAGRQELFRQINSGQLPEAIDTIPEPWQTLIRRCLITEPAERIKSARDAKAILAGPATTPAKPDTPADNTHIDRPKPPPPITPPPPGGRGVARNAPTATPTRPPKNRNPLWYALAGCAIALLVFFLFKPTPKPKVPEPMVVEEATPDTHSSPPASPQAENTKQDIENYLKTAQADFAAARYDAAFTGYKKAKDLGSKSTEGYSNFVNKAEEMLTYIDCDDFIKNLLNYARQLNVTNDSKVDQLSSHCR